jgi:hypothetical protein
MNPKNRPHHREYLTILRSLGPEGRLKKAFELSETAKKNYRLKILAQFPTISDDQINQILILRSQISSCIELNIATKSNSKPRRMPVESR